MESKALRGNLLGDPTRRTVAVYLPEGCERIDGGCPLLVYLASFTGSGLQKISWRMFGESVPQRVDRLIAEGRMGPVAVAFPDCFTSLGGNQYVNSPAMGRWEDFLLEDMLPQIEERFPVRRGPDGRAVLGFSSGGYGALVQALKHGRRWAAAACHSADMGFEVSLRGDFPRAATVLARCDGDLEAFLARFADSEKVRGEELHTLMILALAASYDPDPKAFKGIRLPFDLKTCQVDPLRWRRWLDWDPLHLLEKSESQENLKRLKRFYFDCGSRDQYHLQYGARRLARRLEELTIPHRYDEFDDDHSGVEYRLDVSLPILYAALGA